MSVYSATVSADEADTWAVLVSSLSARDAVPDNLDNPMLDTTVVDLVDHFAVLGDPRHQQWVEHPLAAVLVLCAAAVMAGMRGFIAVTGWVADTPPELLREVYARCGKPAAVPPKSTIWQAVTHTDAVTVDAAVGLWLTARAGIDIAVDTPGEPGRPRNPTGRGRAAPARLPSNGRISTQWRGHRGRSSRWTAHGSVAPRTPTTTPRTCWPPTPTSRVCSSLTSTSITQRMRSRCSCRCWTP